LSCSAPTGKSHFILAERLFKDKKYPTAIEELKKITENDPNSVLSQQALFRIATIQYLYVNNYKEALKTFKQFNFLSQNKELVYQSEKTIAEIYFTKQEDYKSSIESYKKLIEKYPESKELDFFKLRLAKANYSILNFKEVQILVDQLLKEYPKSILLSEALYLKANSYFTQGKLDMAMSAFEDVLVLYPKSSQAIFAEFGMANCYEEKDQLDEALEIYQKILDKHPSKQVIESKIRRLEQRMNRQNRNSKD
jgi:tetratricopeptide (TPR) repeat protein